MQLALHAARQSLYITSPNPRVGCVIEHKGQVIATGATQMAGGPHAEVMALAQAAQAGYTQLHEATVYVTLEPCSHYGRTPPCVDALIQARPRCVVIAMLDPNPQVAGQGVAKTACGRDRGGFRGGNRSSFSIKCGLCGPNGAW